MSEVAHSRLARRVSSALALALALAPSDAWSDEPVPESRWEPGVVPALNYDSDIGFGFGAVGTLARFEPGFEPYRLRFEAQLFTSLAIDAAGSPSLPFHDDYLRADVPGLFDDRLRLSGGVFFRKLSSSGYYGIGQRTQARSFTDEQLEDSEAARRYHTYDHTSVGVDLVGRITLARLPRPGDDARLEWLSGVHGAYHDLAPYAGSLLEADASGAGSSLLHGVGEHGVLSTDAGLVWDDRDHEFWPTRGSLTELSSRWSAGLGEHLRFARFHLSTRWFSPIFGDALVFAQRAGADLIVGDAPLYELGLFGVLEPTDATGGSKGIRGVPLGRAVGKAKLLGSAELRAQAPWFSIAGERFRIGFVAFVDAGRAFSDLPPDAALDGPWAPFDLGVGGGLRLRWAETFVLRADGAWSPTRGSPGVYIDVGQVF
jgi:outer membrane protein assembly factor BamA